MIVVGILGLWYLPFGTIANINVLILLSTKQGMKYGPAET
jgi:hypothetical protein